MSNLGIHFSSDKSDWETPDELFDKLNPVFQFDIDVCATAENAKVERFYSPEDDGLAQDWLGTCWMNPPYGRGIGKWAGKAWESGAYGNATTVCLVPARTDTRWWWTYCRKGDVLFLPGRLQFKGAKYSAPFPSAIVVFWRDLSLRGTHTFYWDWRRAPFPLYWMEK